MSFQTWYGTVGPKKLERGEESISDPIAEFDEIGRREIWTLTHGDALNTSLQGPHQYAFSQARELPLAGTRSLGGAQGLTVKDGHGLTNPPPCL